MTYGIFDEYNDSIKYFTPKVRINNLDNNLLEVAEIRRIVEVLILVRIVRLI